MGLDLDKKQLEREEHRAAEVAVNHVKTLDSLVTPRVGLHGVFRAKFKALVKRILTPDELRILADE